MGTEKNRNRTVDFVKGAAILFIVFTHYDWTVGQRRIFVFPYLINMAVPILMIITGYVYSLSLQKKNVAHLEDAYQGSVLLRRSVRYCLPLIVLAVWEICDPHFHLSGGFLDYVRWFINGTAGKGNYYFPVMLQMVFLFPIIYFILEKKKRTGLFICLIFNLTYEVLAWSYGMNTDCYRLLAFRYVFVVAAGIYAFKKFKMNLLWSILITAAGAVFISALVYTDYQPKIINADWAGTNCIASMLVIPLMIWLLKYGNLRFVPLEIIGKASYHIFLVQMAYYAGYYPILSDKLGKGPVLLLIGMAICLIIGIAFYLIDQPVQKAINKLYKK